MTADNPRKRAILRIAEKKSGLTKEQAMERNPLYDVLTFVELPRRDRS